MRVFADPGSGGDGCAGPAPTARPDSAQVARTIGARIRARRRLLGLTQADLARDCGVCFQQIQKYEGGGTLSVGRLMAIAYALGAPIAYFFEGLDEGAAGSGRAS